MKTLIILAVILGILFFYFISTEKSLIKGSEVVPGGVDIPKLILDKVRGIKSQITNEDIKTIGDNTISDSEQGQGFVNNIITGAKNLVSKAVTKIGESVKDPIENKIQEIVCPAK